MNRNVEVRTPSGSRAGVHLIGFPDECPRCHSKGVPVPLHAVRVRNDGPSDVEESYQCANQSCGGIFIGLFHQHPGQSTKFIFVRGFPVTAKDPPISEDVAAVSPTFVETYSQSLAAEGAGLHQLTGIGLRKALEFLVKDFAVSTHPDEKEKILSKTLAACIKDYLADPNLKATAKRAAWLGNDETHYLRRWEDKDISDLKILIRLTTNWVENVLLTAKYVDDMPE